MVDDAKSVRYSDACGLGVVPKKFEHLSPDRARVALKTGEKKNADWGKMGSKKILKAEVESGELADDQTATFGLSQLMAKGAITLHDGVVEQRNFDSYVLPYMPDAPVALLFSRQGSMKHGAYTPRAKFAVAKQIYWRTAIVANPELGDLHGP